MTRWLGRVRSSMVVCGSTGLIYGKLADNIRSHRRLAIESYICEE